ncbi:hydroxyisourate hydrolase [Metapseudomonas lalkuanensis]|uniref:Hydroxyisourate hydrolase n=1 Tax=Metapseudomonas lalkuanensis TaxID=2604832 RepID=A0A5J6QMW8_9GAMM|nr:hydroxyisourate hydrolase [Pseudomonas lalkuanensis]QEY62641.1 hydroxyisourate hydrolase [Pseudomonas lalkuanensis]UCO96135.1 hydroxyisourate hydrolase [Pseudomonas lalkuanensis]
MNGGISIHVVDVASGSVAEGLEVRLERLEGADRELVCAGRIGGNGLLTELAGLAERCRPGVYEARLRVADFYRARGMQLPEPPFLDELAYRFGIGEAAQHYHLPFKLTAWGVSCFRGGA